MKNRRKTKGYRKRKPKGDQQETGKRLKGEGSRKRAKGNRKDTKRKPERRKKETKKRPKAD